MDPDIVFADSPVLIIISEAIHFTALYFHIHIPDFPALDCLIRDFLAEPGRRGEQYRLDGDKCARLASVGI